MQFLFGDHTLDADRRELRRGAEPISVEPQVFDLLIYLVENRDRVVSKDDLIASVWGGRIVSDSTLTSRINAARKAVGDSGGNQKLIRTIARKGLRFVGDVRVGPLNVDSVDLMSRAQGDAQESSRPALPLPDRPAIAVLPFVNLSGDPEQEYFSDGISEDIIAALSKLRWFFVIARNSSFTFKGKAVHMKQIAEELGVGYVVEGSVRKSGERVRITAQLNDVATGAHVWAERYDRDIADVFAVQDEITEAIVAAIEPQLYAAENFRSAALIFGVLAGVAWTNSRGGFSAEGSLGQRLLRLVPGLIGILILYLGLRVIFPGGDNPLAYFFRYLRYGLVGLWMTAGAPWLFNKLKLAG